VTGQWFSPVSTTNKTDHHITEILLKVALNIINPKLKLYFNTNAYLFLGSVNQIFVEVFRYCLLIIVDCRMKNEHF